MTGDAAMSQRTSSNEASRTERASRTIGSGPAAQRLAASAKRPVKIMRATRFSLDAAATTFGGTNASTQFPAAAVAAAAACTGGGACSVKDVRIGRRVKVRMIAIVRAAQATNRNPNTSGIDTPNRRDVCLEPAGAPTATNSCATMSGSTTARRAFVQTCTSASRVESPATAVG
jgi:hypothetical protein